MEDASILNPLFVLGVGLHIEALIVIAGTMLETCVSKSSLFISSCLREGNDELSQKHQRISSVHRPDAEHVLDEDY